MLSYFVYIFEILGITFILVKLIRKIGNMRVASTLSLWGLRVLSGLLFLLGIFMILIAGGFFIFLDISFELYHSLLSNVLTIFLGLFGYGLLFVSSYALFKFKMKSGIIVYRG